jgi:hypothetical protein
MATAALVIGAVISAYSAVRAGQAQSAQAKYMGKVAQQNADATLQQGAAAQAAQRKDAMRKLGLMEANYGASGVDSSTGSPLDVLSDSVGQSTLDNLNTKYNYQLKALGYQNSAALDDATASNATTSGYLSAAGSLLGGAGKAYGQYSGTGTPVTS